MSMAGRSAGRYSKKAGAQGHRIQATVDMDVDLDVDLDVDVNVGTA